MPLPLPRLDTHNLDQLIAEGTALLPRLAPGWTDYNTHDPGITLMELLAWLVEMDSYQLDRTSEAAFRAFLRLVGIQVRPARVAETVLVFTARGGTQPVIVPPDSQAANPAGSVAFQTSRGLAVSPARLVALLAGAEGALADVSAQNALAGQGLAPLGADPQPDDAFYLGFDRPPSATGSEVSLYVWIGSPAQDAELTDRLIREYDVETPDAERCAHPAPCPRPDWRQHYSARTRWEYFAASGRWLPVAEPDDETRALTLSGAVRFKLPPTPPPAQGGVPARPNLYFIRCRLDSGYYECPPRLGFVALNAVSARHAVSVDTHTEVEMLSDGRARQTYTLQAAPVVPGSTRLQVRVKGVAEDWREALTWDQVRPHDRTYVLSPESGQIVFGDGLHGRVPASGAQIAAVSYRAGGGAAGNVPAQTLSRYLGVENVDVAQPFAAFGGAPAESLTEAKGRAIQWLSAPQRAVTLADFESLALATPGAPISRAHALADYDPALPGLPALGSITVVIVPACANPIPEPGPDLLQAAAAYLERRRTLTTELHVISPAFVTVGVRAALHAGAALDAAALAAEAEARLNAFLDPLRGGPAGEGWPIGRDVYPTEIMALLNAIPGVEYVDDVWLDAESRLDVYQGYITWTQVFERGETATGVHAQLRGERWLPASRLTARARLELEHYFQSARSQSKHVSRAARRQDVMAVLRSVAGVLRVEDVKLEDKPGSGAGCGQVTVCAHGLVVPGRHHLTVSGARSGSPRATQPPC